MSKSEFNPNVFQGIRRWVRVAKSTNIQKLLIWNGESNRYEPPKFGKGYEARRNSIIDGKKKREKKSFSTLEEARSWCQRLDPDAPQNGDHPMDEISSGPKFSEIVAKFLEFQKTRLALGTYLQNEKLTRLHFGNLLTLGIHQITAKVVDEWLESLIQGVGKTHQSKIRTSFNKELVCLTSIMNWYKENFDDTEFVMPIKKRHRVRSKFKRAIRVAPREMTEEHFAKFIMKLLEGPYGKIFSELAIVQCFQSLRISEVAGLHWDDIEFDFDSPSNSRITIRRRVEWTRRKGDKPYIVDGFKNSRSVGDSKMQPLRHQSFDALFRLKAETDAKKGLVFSIDGTPLSYRKIQYAFDKAFAEANLPFSATHILRHAGCRWLYDDTKDLGMAGQLLGDTSKKAIETYAKRKPTALIEYTDKEWRKYLELDWPQKAANQETES